MSSKLITPIFFSFSPLSLQIDTHSSPFDLRAYGAIGSASDFGSEGCRFEPCYARILHSYTHTSTKKVHPPGLEPGSPPWKGGILPLDHECYCIWLFLTLLLFSSFFLFPFAPFFLHILTPLHFLWRSHRPDGRTSPLLSFWFTQEFTLTTDWLMRRRWFNSSWDLFFPLTLTSFSPFSN